MKKKGPSIPKAWLLAVQTALAHWRAHFPQVGSDPESVHQSRVALRRLRVLLRLGEALELVTLAKGLHRRLRRLGRALGEVRDRDVLLAGPSLPASVSGRLLGKREKKFGRALALARADAQIFQTLARLRPRDPPEAQKRYAHVLRRLWRRVRKRGKDLDRRGARGLHRLRVAAKRLRYSLDSFTPLRAPQYRRQVPLMKELQKILGEINDIENRHRLLKGLVTRSILKEDRRRWGRIKSERVEKLLKVWRRLN